MTGLTEQAGNIRITPGDMFHGRPALRFFLQTRHRGDGGIAQGVHAQFDRRRRRHLPDLLLDLGDIPVERMLAGIDIIGQDAEGEDVAFEPVREVAVPFLRGHVFRGADEVLFFVGDEGRQMTFKVRMGKINQHGFLGRGGGDEDVHAFEVVVDDGPVAENAGVQVRHRLGDALQYAVHPGRGFERAARLHEIVQRAGFDIFQKQPVRGRVIGERLADARMLDPVEDVSFVRDEDLIPKLLGFFEQRRTGIAGKLDFGELRYPGIQRQDFVFANGGDFHAARWNAARVEETGLVISIIAGGAVSKKRFHGQAVNCDIFPTGRARDLIV